MKMYLTIGALLLAVGAGGAWYKGRIDAAELRGRLDTVWEQLQDARATYSADSAAAAERDSAHAAEVRELKATQETLEANLATTRTQARRELAGARATIADLQSQGVDVGNIAAAVDSLEAEANQCSLALANCGQIVKELDDRVADLIRHDVDDHVLIANQDDALNALRELQPSAPVLPWIVAGVSTAALLAALIFGS